jgi:hypothetical protein
VFAALGATAVIVGGTVPAFAFGPPRGRGVASNPAPSTSSPLTPSTELPRGLKSNPPHR